MRNALFLLLAASALASCRPAGDRQDAAESGAVAADGVAGGRVGDPVKRGAENVTAETLPRNLAVAEPGNTSAPVQEPTPAVADLAIPQPLQGRWGLVPADCERGRSDAKRLLTIDGRTVRFYESVGTLQERQPAAGSSFSGRFAFSGEGMNWERTITLTRTGDRLRRVEQGGDQPAVDLTYTACPE